MPLGFACFKSTETLKAHLGLWFAAIRAREPVARAAVSPLPDAYFHGRWSEIDYQLRFVRPIYDDMSAVLQ